MLLAALGCVEPSGCGPGHECVAGTREALELRVWPSPYIMMLSAGLVDDKSRMAFEGRQQERMAYRSTFDELVYGLAQAENQQVFGAM